MRAASAVNASTAALAHHPVETNVLNIVLLLPPAPAALVLLGLAFATLSALSAAAFLLIAVAGPPGGFGDDGRAVVEPVEGDPGVSGAGMGEDCCEYD